MIPKIIHYTWFSGDTYPSTVQDCLDSWSKYLPEYELKLWDMEAVKDIDSIFLQEALDARQWAFAADYVRLWAVYHEGGIYLDTDVLLYDSFDKFLDHNAFIGKERYLHFKQGKFYTVLGSHCFGAEKEHPFIKSCLDYYQGRHFVTSTNEDLTLEFRYSQVLMPYIQARFACDYGFEWSIKRRNDIQLCEFGLMVYPYEYFDSSYSTKPAETSICTHLALGSWRDKELKQPDSITLLEKVFWRFGLPIFRKILGKFGYFICRYE